MNEEEEWVDLEEVDNEIRDVHTELIKENTRMVNRSRRQHEKMHALADKYEEMASNCREIAALHVLGARQCADSLADLIDGEFDLTILDMGNEEEGEDDE